MKNKFLALVIFSCAFGFVEAAVVIYLRSLLGYQAGYVLTPQQNILNLGLIDFVRTNDNFLGKPMFLNVEMIREIATIIMLGSIAYISVKDKASRFGAFLIAFSLWDLTYYLFLKILTGWPESLFTTDVYFLVPITWIGPVITPIIAFLIILALGIKIFFNKNR